MCYLETSGAPELWTSDRRPRGVVAAELERICQRCPVRRECAAEAVETGAQNGTYAGVYVCDTRQSQSWLAAMRELARIAGDVLDYEQLGVSA